MTRADDLESAADAKESIEADGRLVQLFKLNREPDDATKPWRGTANQPHPSKGGAEIPVKMVFVPASGSGFGKLLQTEPGSLAIAYTEVGMLATDSIPTPFTFDDVEKCDKVRDGDRVWSVVTRGHLKPGEVSIMFVLGLRA